ncbi:hypothetical protein L6452_05803 [Arctium lappa]|uniref:Uncharacterized protein n=1 Tax=Arctium lappa TaxID=4217 RepID=A0ACB9EH50_ARCLA|nr:hypothetical protein L6452_05803 [Arctium lappa]
MTLIADCVVSGLSIAHLLHTDTTPFFSHVASSPPSLVHIARTDDVMTLFRLPNTHMSLVNVNVEMLIVNHSDNDEGPSAQLSSQGALLKEILSILQQPQFDSPSFTPLDREALVMTADFVVFHNQTLSIDDDKEREGFQRSIAEISSSVVIRKPSEREKPSQRSVDNGEVL